MRTFHRLSAGRLRAFAALLAASLVIALAQPTGSTAAADPDPAPVPPVLEPHFVPGQIFEYHDISQSLHAQNVPILRSIGYRPLSISVYGPASSPRYAAVWVKREGPSFETFQGLNVNEVAALDAEYRQQGYVPTMITATGEPWGTVFAGVYEYAGDQDTSSHSLSLINTAGELRDQVTALLQDEGTSVLRSVTSYGSGPNQKFAFITAPNDTLANWDASVNDEGADWKRTNTALRPAGFRPRIVALGSSHNSATAPIYTAVWSDERLAGAYTQLVPSSAALIAEIKRARKAGFEPVAIDGATVAQANQFAVTFAEYDTPMRRLLSVTGAVQPNLAGFDEWMTNFLATQGVRAGSLAIARDGKLVYARAFTLAETDYPVTTPTSTFRIASASKPLTALATMQVIEREKDLAGGVRLTTPVQSILELKTPQGTVPPSPFDQVTVDQLLCQRSGINDTVHGFNDEAVASTFGKPLPVSKGDWISWGAAQGSDFAPGTAYDYVNYNFTLAGEVVAKRASRLIPHANTYEQAVRRHVFEPLGITRPRIGRSPITRSLPGEVRYESPIGVNGGSRVLSKSVMDPLRSPVANSYGGWNQGNLDSMGGWVLAPADFAKVVSSFDDGTSPLFKSHTTFDKMWSLCASDTTSGRGWYYTNQPIPGGGTLPAWDHNGGLPSTAFLVIRRVDGLSFVVAFNGTTRGGGLYDNYQGTELFEIANDVTTWPTKDLFPSVGIPSNK